jgi:hypothetical protein
MEFNKNWSKEDNDKLRSLIKENKSAEYIRDFFTNDKLFYHPSKKYYLSNKSAPIPTFKNKIEDFTGFINEIKYQELETDFQVDFEKSKQFTNDFNYYYKFQTNSGNRYIVDFIYLKDKIGPFPNQDIYNLSFTLEENHNLLNYKDYENPSMLEEQHELIKRIIFIVKDFYNKFGNKCIFLIGETEDKRKIKWYRNLINDSFNNVIETEGVSSYTNGMKGYYFKIK